MKEEDKLIRKVGTDNPFTVPEGYFENLTSEVMSKLPEQKEKPEFEIKEPTRWERVKPWAYMAAMFAGAALIINVASRNPNPFGDTTDTAVVATTEAQTEYISDEELDYALTNAMFDDYSLYVYLTDAEN